MVQRIVHKMYVRGESSFRRVVASDHRFKIPSLALPNLLLSVPKLIGKTTPNDTKGAAIPVKEDACHNMTKTTQFFPKPKLSHFHPQRQCYDCVCCCTCCGGCVDCVKSRFAVIAPVQLRDDHYSLPGPDHPSLEI